MLLFSSYLTEAARGTQGGARTVPTVAHTSDSPFSPRPRFRCQSASRACPVCRFQREQRYGQMAVGFHRYWSGGDMSLAGLDAVHHGW